MLGAIFMAFLLCNVTSQFQLAVAKGLIGLSFTATDDTGKTVKLKITGIS